MKAVDPPIKIRATLQEAMGLHQRGSFAHAERLYISVLTADPRQFEALHYLGVLRLQQQRSQEAVDLISAAVSINPASTEALSNLAVGFANLKRYVEALDALDRIIKQRPNDADAHYNRATVLDASGRRNEALAAYQKVLAYKPNNFAALFGTGNTLTALERYEDALCYFDRALAIAPRHLDVLNNRAAALGKLERNDDVAQTCGLILAIQPNHVLALNNLSNALRKLGRHEEARAAADKAVAIAPDYVDALTSLGTVLYDMHRYDDAAAAYRRCLAVNPSAEGHRNLALVLTEMHQFETALSEYANALALRPAYPEALRESSQLLAQVGKVNAALNAVDKYLELAPDDEVWLLHRSGLLGGMDRLPEAIADARKVAAKQLTDPAILSNSIHMLVGYCGSGCDWVGMREAARRLPECKPVSPSILARISDDTALLLRSAVDWSGAYTACAKPHVHDRRRQSGKIRVGYVSQDFRAHVTGDGIVEIFEQHDKSRFELFGFALTRDDGSLVRKRIAGAVHQFHDVSLLTDEAAARQIYDSEIDVLVQLVPHSAASREPILACRPAPVQVNLWSAGYSGGPYYDYIVGDKWSLPDTDQPFYLEKIVQLPHTCFPYDTTRQIAKDTPTRFAEGLPERGFVFCCFNTSYKISAEIFALWMRLLHAVEGSVLWLARNSDLAVENLRAAARDHGIDPSRLVFAQRKPDMADHLARHRLADLFLDTLPYNAHTTAMDALWAGLPVVTCTGRSFVGRVATSQLHGIGLPELVTANLDEYERLALDLARNTERLRELRGKVETNRLTFPLFDMKRLCRELESAYAGMAEISRRGESPRGFAIKDTTVAPV